MPPAPLVSPVPVPTTRFRPRAWGWGAGAGTPTPGTPDTPGAGVDVGSLALVPRVTDKKVPETLRRFTEKVADPLNALMRAGILVKTGPETWTIDLTGGGGSSSGLTVRANTPGTYGTFS